MATFSPSPAPRRITRSKLAATSPRALASSNATGRVNSRLATPVRNRPPAPTDQDSVFSGMDVDEGGSSFSERPNSRVTTDTLYAKSDQFTVSFYASLPVELKQVLKNANFFRDVYTGDIDTLTGFALVASAQTCFVWQHAQALRGTPTCYIFSCPQDPNHLQAPFHALIPYNSAREPGLILMSSDGVIRFWDSIGIGLAGGDRYTTIQLDLSLGESVTNLIRSDPQTYVVSTTAGNLFRLTLTSSGGKYHLSSHVFSRPSQSLSLSRLLPSFFSSTPASGASFSHSKNISSVALGPKTGAGGREVWAIVDTRFQRWSMSPEGWEQLLLEEDMLGILSAALRKTFGPRVDADDQKLDLELLDLAVDNQTFAVLMSYAATEDEMAMVLDGRNVRRVYALAFLAFQENNTFTVGAVRSVPYESTLTDNAAPMHPRIKMALDGALVCIQFGNAVALCSRDVNYRSRIELKSSVDRTLGVGVTQDGGPVVVLTAGTMMRVTLNLSAIMAYEIENGESKLVKSAMTQAILFSGLPDNPLHFSLPPDLDEQSLMQGAEQLSQAVLESDPEIIQKNHDLTTQLTERKERLSWLIRFINDNAALSKISQQCRQKLATDAEKLFACFQLWTRHNELLATNPTHSILNDAVHAYMQEINQGHHEDVIRAFFRLRVADIGRLIRKVAEAATHAARITQRDIIEFLPEANRIILTAINSAFDYREYNLQVYGIELPMVRPWSSKPAVIDVVLSLFDATTKAVEASNLAKNDSKPSSQLPELAAVLFACIQERLDWLGSSVAASDPGNQRDHEELSKKFDMLRPEVLETLRRNGHSGAAFSLAEKYRDFSGLASLCHKETVYPPEDNPNSLRIQAYIERFKDEFTTELYRWYIQHGELRVLFAHDHTHNAHIDKYFAENPDDSISWIHALGQGSYATASATLLKEAEQANNLDAKHLMLSIGKLSHLAQLHESKTATIDNAVLDAFHDDLDFVSVHETLLQEFRSALDGVRGRQTLDNQIDTIVKATAAGLQEKPALRDIFKDLVRGLLQGRALCIEDAVDVLTLKDNNSNVEDFATALHLLARVQNLPEARAASAFRTVWRRVYIHDDWDAIRKTANISDAELSARFRSTAVYNTLCAVLAREHGPTGYETSPDEALITPGRTEITSRWPGLTEEQVEALVQDYNLECDRLGDLDLNDVFHRVRELAVQDVQWQADA